uniref:Phospholipase DDHD1-like n=1 Tax=Sinocyclocheilus rhinocerous TaxID=307959 RepID=A0A673HGC2_9TELE
MSSLTKKTRFINNPGNKLSFGNRDWNDAFISLYEESSGRGTYAVRSDTDRHSSPRDTMTLRLGNHHNPASDALPKDYYHGKERLLGIRKAARSCASRHRFEVITELGPEEVRWFYKEDKKTWKPFMGHDSLRIEIMYRRFCELNPGRALNRESRGGEEIPEDDGLDGGQSSLDTSSKERNESADTAIEAVCVRGGLYEVDVRNKECYPVYWNQQDCIPVMRGQWFIDKTALVFMTWLSRNHVDWYSVDEVYLYSDATTSKIARTVTQKLGFSKASSSGTRLHRGFVEEASLDDKPPQTTHIVFVVHVLRSAVSANAQWACCEEHVEFLPVEWRSKLALDGDTVESITPDKVRGLRDLLNSSAMDIMYYTSPLYRDEITKGLTQELNRLYSLFCSRNPEFESRGGKVSIISHSLGCVITFDIMTGWDPVRFCLQEHRDQLEDEDMHWTTHEERHLLKDVLRDLQDQLQGLKASKPAPFPTLKFKVENFFCMGSPLAVFLALRGIRPGNTGDQDHIMPKSILSNKYIEVLKTQQQKKSLLGAASISKGISGILFSHFSRSPSLPSAVDSGIGDSEDGQSTFTFSAISPSSSSSLFDAAVEMEHRIDYELREGLVESRYWSAVTSHTAYWTSHDVALFLLTFIYKQQSTDQTHNTSPM